MKLFQLSAQYHDSQAGQHPMHGKLYEGYSSDHVREYIGKIMAREAQLVDWDLQPVEVERITGGTW